MDGYSSTAATAPLDVPIPHRTREPWNLQWQSVTGQPFFDNQKRTLSSASDCTGCTIDARAYASTSANIEVPSGGPTPK